MHAMITGANGFLGNALARALAARGDKVKCLVREGSDASALAGIAVERVQGDVTDPASLRVALRGVDTVFHLAGIRRAAVRDEFMRVNAQATRMVCEEMVRAGARRMVLCSSLAATGPSSAVRPSVESDPYRPEEWYGESKAEAERLAFAFAGKLEVTSCRPSRIVGPRDRENLIFFKLVKRGVVLRLSGPRRPLSMVDVEDVVNQLVLQAERPEAVGESFFCSSDETASVEELLQMVATTLNLEPRTVYLPGMLLRTLAYGADVVTKVSGRKMPLNRKLARQLLAPAWTCSIEKAKTVLGYSPRYTLAQSLHRSAEQYVRDGWL